MRTFIAIISCCFSFLSCIQTPTNELIIGSWQIIHKGDLAELEGVKQSLGLKAEKKILEFNFNKTIQSKSVLNGIFTEKNSGTYQIINNGSTLLIYREGVKERKNVAEIITINSSFMTLVNTNGHNDTLYLKKIN